MTVKLLTEHHLEFLSLKGGCRGSSESTLVKMSNCWKSHAAAQIFLCVGFYQSVKTHLILQGTNQNCLIIFFAHILSDMNPAYLWFFLALTNKKQDSNNTTNLMPQKGRANNC